MRRKRRCRYGLSSIARSPSRPMSNGSPSVDGRNHSPQNSTASSLMPPPRDARLLRRGRDLAVPVDDDLDAHLLAGLGPELDRRLVEVLLERRLLDRVDLAPPEGVVLERLVRVVGPRERRDLARRVVGADEVVHRGHEVAEVVRRDEVVVGRGRALAARGGLRVVRRRVGAQEEEPPTATATPTTPATVAQSAPRPERCSCGDASSAPCSGPAVRCTVSSTGGVPNRRDAALPGTSGTGP